MSRRYSPQEKQLVLQRIIANGFDIRLTCLQTGIPERTLLTWRTKYLSAAPPPPQQQGGFPPAGTPQLAPLPANKSQALLNIQRELMEKVNLLSHSIDEAIAEAPLVQRSTALAQMIDRVVKISTLVPPDPQEILLEDEFGEDSDDEAQYTRPASQPVGNHQE